MNPSSIPATRLSFRLGTPADCETIALIGAQAYQNYEYFTIFFPNPQQRLRFGTQLQRTGYKVALIRDRVLIGLLDGHIACAAELIAPTDHPQTSLDFLRAGLPKMLRAGGLRNTIEWLRMQQETSRVCHHLPQPHWYINSLAVAPHLQGQNLGSEMLQHCIIPFVAQHGGGLLTLITNNDPNRFFYLKNGFYEFSTDMFSYRGQQLPNYAFSLQVSPQQ